MHHSFLSMGGVKKDWYTLSAAQYQEIIKGLSNKGFNDVMKQLAMGHGVA